jgi:hypothetical protein
MNPAGDNVKVVDSGQYSSKPSRKASMTSSSVPLWVSAVCVSLTLLMCLALDASSLHGWVLATTVGVVPPFVLLRLWSNSPLPTVAEAIHATEVCR